MSDIQLLSDESVCRLYENIRSRVTQDISVRQSPSLHG